MHVFMYVYVEECVTRRTLIGGEAKEGITSRQGCSCTFFIDSYQKLCPPAHIKMWRSADICHRFPSQVAVGHNKDGGRSSLTINSYNANLSPLYERESAMRLLIQFTHLMRFEIAHAFQNLYNAARGRSSNVII